MEMRSDLDRECSAAEGMWNKRATQLDRLALNTAGMYGELEALMGAALPAVDLLELPAPGPLAGADRPAA